MKSEITIKKGAVVCLAAILVAAITLLVAGFIILQPVNADPSIKLTEGENAVFTIGDGEFAAVDIDGKISFMPLNEAAAGMRFEEIDGIIYAVYETFEQTDSGYMSGYALVPVELP